LNFLRSSVYFARSLMIPHGFQQAAGGEITLDSCRKCLK
jgi:hypothetical protein